MRPVTRSLLSTAVLLVVCLGLFLIFPRAFAFTELAARELRYFWWLILLVALACWLIWGFKKRP